MMLKRELFKHRFYFLLLVPAVVYYVLFSYLPMGGIIIAFKDYKISKGFLGSEWVGLKWFEYLISTPDFLSVLKNTFIISVYLLIFSFPAPIILAILLNECEQMRFKKLVQTVSYLPHFLSWSIIAGFMVTMLAPTGGIINQIIKLFGGESIYFMADPHYTRALLVLSSIWKEIGWGSIIYLAALTNISPELYEAAIIDGASKWKRILNITLPGISNLITMMLVLNCANLLKVGFEHAYNIVIAPTFSTGQVISTYVYRIGIQNSQYSFATAVGLAQSIVSIVLLTIANKTAKRFNEEGAVW